MDLRALYDSRGQSKEIWGTAEALTRFFAPDHDVRAALARILAILEEVKSTFWLTGALALSAHGLRADLPEIEVLLSSADWDELRGELTQRGYEILGHGARDQRNGVFIQMVTDASWLPSSPQMELLTLGRLIEMKLTSGMRGPHRMKDLTDVLELIRAAKLPRELSRELDESVRAKYDELWLAAASAPPDEVY